MTQLIPPPSSVDVKYAMSADELPALKLGGFFIRVVAR